MNRRVFEPRPDNAELHRWQAIRLALVVLAAGYLALWYLRQSPTPPPTVNSVVNVKVNHVR